MWKKCFCFDEEESQHLLDNDKTDIQEMKPDDSGGREGKSLHQHETRHQDLCKDIIVSLVFLFMIIIHCVATLSPQIAGGKVNIFKLNAIRYVVMFFIATVLVLIHRTTVYVEAKYVHKIILTGVFNFILANILFFVPSFMPVGSSEAMYIGIYYLSTTVIDVFKKKMKFLGLLASLITLVGLILMAQPWTNMDENADICQIPCDYWDGTEIHNVTIANISEPETPIHRFSDQQNLIQHNNSCKIEEDQKFIYIDGMKFYISIHPFLLGYIMILVAVVSGLIRAYTIKDLRICIESQTLTFWLASLEGILALLMTIIWSHVTGVPVYSFPSGKICLTFVLSYGFFSGVLYAVWVYLAGYLNISKLALAKVIGLLVLYVCQRTLLKHFHPGKANLFESFGVAIIICGLLMTFCEVIPCLKK